MTGAVYFSERESVWQNISCASDDKSETIFSEKGKIKVWTYFAKSHRLPKKRKEERF